MAKDAKKKKTSSMMPDWSELPEELLPLISKHLENCFDVVHARSISHLWRSTFPFPSCLSPASYSLPAFDSFPFESKDLCTFEKIPLFLFRVRAPAAAALPYEYFLGGVRQDKSEDRIELLPSPLQCSVKVDILESDPVLLNMVNCQILPLGYQYRMIGWDPQDWKTDYRGMAFIPLKKEEGGGGGGEEFAVLLNYANNLFVLRSAEMRWMRLKKTSNAPFSELVAFRGKFYAAYLDGDIFVFDPHSMQRTPLMPSQPLCSIKYLIPSGNNELFLVEKFNPFPEEVIDFDRFACRVSKLDEEASKWVEISDLGDLVLFIGHYGNFCCSAKELPDGCVSRNSILFTNEPDDVTSAYKCGVHTGRADDNLNFWRLSREKRVRIFDTFQVAALGVVGGAEYLALHT